MSSKILVNEFINKYTKEINLRIPLIQRNYKWPANAKKDNSNAEFGVKEKGRRNTAHNLIWEIIDNNNNNKEMTLGIVVLYEEQNECKTLLILDGQQRIITLSLIVRYLLKEIKCDEKNMDTEWFRYTFERDFNKPCRSKYMFELDQQIDNNKSVDLKRMEENYKEIKNVIKGNIPDKYENAKVEYYTNLLSYIKEKVYFIVRTTTTPPLDEFLNINNYKTPFSICDYIKVLLINDIYDDKKLNEGEKSDKKNEVLSLYRDIAYYIYYKDKNSENQIYKMVSSGYDNICGSLSVNRMDLIFEDKYNPSKKKTIDVDKADIISIYEHGKSEKVSAFDAEMVRMKYFSKVFKGIDEELYTKDNNNDNHINSNAFNAFYVLNKYSNKRFFSLFSDEDIKKQNDPNQIFRSFCLQEFCAEQTKKLQEFNASNAFIDSVMHCKIKDNIFLEKNEITVNNKETFEEVNKLFFDLYGEYTEIIKKGKEINNNQKNDENIKYIEPEKSKGTNNQKQDSYSICELFKNHDKIIIPDLQREYIKGCDAEDFIIDILEKITGDMFKNFKQEDFKFFNSDIKAVNDFFNGVIPKQEIAKKEIPENFEFEIDFIKNYWFNQLVYGNKDKNLWKFLPNGYYTYEDLDKRYKCNDINNINFEKKLTDVKALLNGKLNDLENKVKYTASCVIGYCDSNNNLFVYDGQQRIVTFLCAIGYLKRKADEVPEDVDKLYEKFIFFGRTNANKSIEELYESKKDDDALLKTLQSLICDQTTDAIYKIVQKLKNMCDEGIYMPYQYFYTMMYIEYYEIDQLDEATQLFMDINDGCKLEPYEIYKAEFVHYLIEKSSCINYDVVKEIQKKLDNSFINLFIEFDNPEEKEISVLKELIKITYIERFHNYKCKDFPTSLKDIVDKFSDAEFIKKLNGYMGKFEEYYRKKDNININKFCESKEYTDINPLKYEDIFNYYHFKDNDDGSVCLYCNFDKLKEYIKDENINLNLDLKLKIRYDLSTKGYIELQDFQCNYNLNNEQDENKFNELLKKMTTKDFRDDIEKNKVEYSRTSVTSKNTITISNSEGNLLSEILSNNSLEMDDLENLFFGESVKLDLSKCREFIIEKLNGLSDKSAIYNVLVSNYDIVYIDGDIYVYVDDKYKKILDKKDEKIQCDNDEIKLHEIKLNLNKIRDNDQKNVDITKIFSNINNSNIEGRKMQLLVLLLLKCEKCKIWDDTLFKKYDDNVYSIKKNNNNNMKFKYKNGTFYTLFKENYYCYNENMEVVSFKGDEL